MKRLGMAFIVALLALAFVAGPVLADGGNASVTCSDITVTDDSPTVGTTITFYGTVTIVANASATTDYYSGWTGKDWTVASAESAAWYEVYDPDGALIASGSSTVSSVDEGAIKSFFGFNYCTDDAYADAGQTFGWNADVPVDLVGDYIATQGGDVTVYYGNYSQSAHWDWCTWNWVWDEPVLHETTLTAENSNQRTVTALANASLSTSRTRPILTIQLPAGGLIYLNDHSKQFFTSDGWGDPTGDVIVYNDGIWQVEIADGTRILLDGTWHDKTWIEIDDQGNVISRYGSDGHIIATEIALSSPITVTKVG